MTEHGFTEERIPVDADDWRGDMTLLYRGTPDAVYDAAVQWVMLRLEETDVRDWQEPDTVTYEIDTVPPGPAGHTTSYELEKEIDRTYGKRDGLPIDDLLGYEEAFDGDREHWWGVDEERVPVSYDGYGRVEEIRVAGETDAGMIDLSAERTALPGWRVEGTLSREASLGECLAHIEHETGIAVADLLDDEIDGTWNWG